MNKIQNIVHPKDKKRIVIIGGGFAGLKLARELNTELYQVVLLDRNNFHQFQPLLYQVATSGLEPSAISFPFRKIFQDVTDFHFRCTEVTGIDLETKIVETSTGEIDYDYLVIATGCRTNFFGQEYIARNTMPLKSIPDAIAARNTLLKNWEQALQFTPSCDQTKLLNIVIVGGGPTGVEMAGALSEIQKNILPADYPEIDFTKMKIYLVEASSRLLAGMSEKSSGKAHEYLKHMKVEVLLNTRVTDFKNDIIYTNINKVIPSQNVFWVAGVTPNVINGIPQRVIGPGKRISTDVFNRIQGYDDTFVIGDLAGMVTTKYPNAHPQVAQVAIQQAKNLIYNLDALAKNKPLKAFHYKDKGSMATIGRNKAVVDLPGFCFSGIFAWFVWLIIHLMAIVGVKNRVFIFINWTLSYITRDSSLRLLISPYSQKLSSETESGTTRRHGLFMQIIQ